jgi:hypothetical protein
MPRMDFAAGGVTLRSGLGDGHPAEILLKGHLRHPSLTYMALTARAAHYAVEQLKQHRL